MQGDSDHLLHAVFDHAGGKEVGLSLPLHCDFPHVLLWMVEKSKLADNTYNVFALIMLM